MRNDPPPTVAGVRVPPIAALDAWRLRLPLERPYRLSFGPVEALDTVLVRLRTPDGALGWGEATLLTGYTDETIEGTWQAVRRIVAALHEARAGSPESAGRALGALLAGVAGSSPFLATAFLSAAEMAAGSPLLGPPPGMQTARVPILGLLQGDTAERIEAEAGSLLAAGYRTLKVKVGFDPEQDARTVAHAQRAVRGRALLRLDANQGYSVEAARAFVERIDPGGIELFEQPCAAGDWDAHLAVAGPARERGLPLMLDESIYSERDIEEAARLRAAAFVKVKLMKFRSLAALDAAIVRIRALGMEPVLGNGVATELSCWMEACVAARRIGNAGEMNGFLKPRERLFDAPLDVADGAIELRAGPAPRIDPDRLARLADARETYAPNDSTPAPAGTPR